MGRTWENKILTLFLSIILTSVSVGCIETNRSSNFNEFDKFDYYGWADNVSASDSISLFEAVDLLISHLDDIYKNSHIIYFVSESPNGINTLLEDGKAHSWTFVLDRNTSGEIERQTVSIGDIGWKLSPWEDSIMTQNYPIWNYTEAIIDSTEIPNIIKANRYFSTFISNFPDSRCYMSKCDLYSPERSPIGGDSYHISIVDDGFIKQGFISTQTGALVKDD